MKIQLNLWRRGAIATSASLLLGLSIAYTMPRGPTTASQALIVMVTSLVVGCGAG
jgi:ABC-type spermidine/putrescine transport system permease subunit I